MRLAPHPVTLRQLQYLVAVADRRSFRGAAEACHVAQPSLSAQVAQAEAALGVRAFERDRRRVVLTSAGAALVEQARALLVGADELVGVARALADPYAGTLRVGVIPTVGPYLLPEVAPALRGRFPRLRVLWSEDKTEALVARLQRAELDAVLLALDAKIGALPHVVLGRDPFLFAASPAHPLARHRRPLRPEELEGERVLLLDEGHCLRDQALALCARAGAAESDYRATSLTTLVQMVASGDGVTLLPSLAAALENRRDSLRLRRFAPQAPGRTLVFAWRRGAALGAALAGVGEALRSAGARLLVRPS